MHPIFNKCRKMISIVVLAMLPYGALAENDVHFESSFESVSDFQGFYIVPITPESSVWHGLDSDVTFSGDFSYHASIEQRNEESTALQNRNHRAYPTVQFHKTEHGVVATPVCISIYVWADFDLQDRSHHGLEDQWISLATFTDDTSDQWRRTVLVNVSHDGIVHLQHTPHQGEQEHIFQSTDIRFPYRQWVNLEVELDFSAGASAFWIIRCTKHRIRRDTKR